MFAKLLTTITSPFKCVLAHKRGDSLTGTCSRDKREEEQPECKMTSFGRISGSCSQVTFGEEEIQWRGFKEFLGGFFHGAVGILNVSLGHNWCSLMCCCGLSVSCHLPSPGLADRGGLKAGRAVQHRHNSVTATKLLWYPPMGRHNQRGCREYRHLFSTGGQGIAVNIFHAGCSNMFELFGSFLLVWEGQLCGLPHICIQSCQTNVTLEYHGVLSFTHPPDFLNQLSLTKRKQ